MKIDFKNLDLKDALDLAILIEEEAQERYAEFVEVVGDRYEGDAGAFFRQMVENEAKHAKDLRARRDKLFSNSPRRVDRSMIWDVEAPGSGSPRVYMSARQAAEIALESEIKAHDFFASALKTVTNPDVKSLFEELKNEEMSHQQMLRDLMKRLPIGDGPDLESGDTDEPPAL